MEMTESQQLSQYNESSVPGNMLQSTSVVVIIAT